MWDVGIRCTVEVSMTAELLADLGMQIVGGKPSVPIAVHFTSGYVCMYCSQ